MLLDLDNDGTEILRTVGHDAPGYTTTHPATPRRTRLHHDVSQTAVLRAMALEIVCTFCVEIYCLRPHRLVLIFMNLIMAIDVAVIP
jgi:hypothetical protein